MKDEKETNVTQEYPVQSVAPVAPVIPPTQQVEPAQVPVPVEVAAPVVAPVQPVPPVVPIVDTPLIQTEKTNKGFWNRAWNKNKLKNPDAVAVLFLHEKRMAEPMILKPIKGFFNIKGKSYHERDDCTYTLKGKDRYPLAIIKEWSITPIGTQDWDEKEVQEKIALFQDHAIKGIRHAERVRLGERNEMQLNAKAMIGIAIMVIVVGAFLLSYL